MIEFKSAMRIGNRIQRHRQAIQLEPALRVLLRFYDGCGAPLPEVNQLIGEEIEGCLTGSPRGKERLQSHLHLLLRARDLHRFAMEPKALTPLKMTVFEHLLFHRTAASRWAAIREVLAGGMDALCESPWPGMGANPERCKLALSDRQGHLGRLLTLVALFNLELEENGLEENGASANALLHFKRGDFPLHHWEFSSEGGHRAHGDAPAGWRPENPLCRWEFLGLDLFHALRRLTGGRDSAGSAWPEELQENDRPDPEGLGVEKLGEDGETWIGGTHPVSGDTVSRHPREKGSEAAGESGSHPPGPRLDSTRSDSTRSEPAPDDPSRPQVFCRLDGRGATGAGQLELFPFDPDTFPASLLALIHRRLGPEGVKLLALTMGRLAEAPPGEPFELDANQVAAAAALNDLSSRGVAARLRRLEKVMELLGGVELTRISRVAGKETVHASRLVTVVERTGATGAPPEAPAAGQGISSASPEEDATPSAMERAPAMRLVVDPVLHRCGAGSLPRLFRGLPEFLCAAGGKHHPFLISLYAYLRRCWAGRAAPEMVERGMDQLIAEAGLWVSPTGRYRALEAIKADLNLLLERGCLGAWRMKRAAREDGQQHRFMLFPPKPDVRQEAEEGDTLADTG